MIKSFKYAWLIGFTAITLSLTGCGESKYVEAEKYQQIETRNTEVQAVSSMAQLKKSLESGTVRNAKLIELYADKIVKDKPDLALIVAELSKESGTKGMLYTGLSSRLDANKEAFKSVTKTLSSSPKDDASYLRALNKYNNTIIPEYQALLGASQPDIYNDALSDIVNTLADLSGDTLARVDGKKSSDFYRETGAENKGAGTLLVGNPNYGEWKTDSSGNSFWAFYGQMMFLNSLLDLGSRPYYYNSWYNNRPYSSYHDYYGSRYGSSKYRTRTAKLNSHYKFNPQKNKPAAAQNYVKKNPTVSKKFNKFDNQFARKAPSSSVLNRTSIKPKAPVSKMSSSSSKYGNQFSSKSSSSSSSKSTRSSGSSRSSRSGK